jgi:HK97 family phage major capsid protein
LTDIDGGATDSAGVVTQGTSNTWSAMVLADFNAVVGKLPQFADTPNTCWVCHKTFYATVMQKLETAAGGNSLQDIANGDRRPRPLFLGYPVEFSQVFPSVTATTGVMCILGDLQLSSVFGDRQQTSIAFSEHATISGESVFERNQIAVRGTERFDINNHGCGDASTVGAVVGLQTA